MFERILLPLDGSSDWESLVPHLEVIGGRTGSEIVVLEAVSFLETLLEMPVSLAGSEFGPSQDTNFAEKYVAAIVGHLRSRGLNARGLTQIGSEAATIVNAARRQRATLVALAVRERGGFPHTLTRTLAEQVLRASPTPIYAVPARTTEDEAPPPAPGGVVLVPVDGTGLSLQVIPPAAEYCRRFSANLRLLHIVPRGADDAAAQSVFKTALERAKREEVPAEAEVGKGDPAEEILRHCSEPSVRMIAMRTRLAMGESHGPLGGVTLRVLRAAKVPMLIVRRSSRVSHLPSPATQSVMGSPGSDRDPQMEPIGKRRWAIAEGYIPGNSQGPEPAMTSHETACLLNAGPKTAHVSIWIFFSDRESAGPYRVDVPARRTLHLRFNDLQDPEPVPRDTDYSSVIESDVPIVVQHTRLDSRQAANALLSTTAFAADG